MKQNKQDERLYMRISGLLKKAMQKHMDKHYPGYTFSTYIRMLIVKDIKRFRKRI